MGMALFNGGLRWGGGAKFGTSTTPCCCGGILECGCKSNYDVVGSGWLGGFDTPLPTGTIAEVTSIVGTAVDSDINCALNAFRTEFAGFKHGRGLINTGPFFDVSAFLSGTSSTVFKSLCGTANFNLGFGFVECFGTTTPNTFIALLELRRSGFTTPRMQINLNNATASGTCCTFTVSQSNAEVSLVNAPTTKSEVLPISITWVVTNGPC
jgi:hypothetical protein